MAVCACTAGVNLKQDEIIEMVKQAGGAAGKPTPTAQVVIFTQHLDIKLFAHLVAAKEREACAKVAEATKAPFTSLAIRARGQK